MIPCALGIADMLFPYPVTDEDVAPEVVGVVVVVVGAVVVVAAGFFSVGNIRSYKSMMPPLPLRISDNALGCEYE